MDEEEQQVRNEYFDDDAIQNVMSLQQYARSKGVIIEPEGKKAGGKIKSYKKGGKVRGAGIAKRGVKKCKYR